MYVKAESGMMEDTLGVPEAIATAIRRVQTFQRQVPASLTWHLAVALDLPPLALIALEAYVKYARDIRSHDD
jgi:hypothetical protein